MQNKFRVTINRTKKSTIEQIFTICQLQEMSWEHNMNFHKLFYDFHQTYDFVDQKILRAICSGSRFVENDQIHSRWIKKTRSNHEWLFQEFLKLKYVSNMILSNVGLKISGLKNEK